MKKLGFVAAILLLGLRLVSAQSPPPRLTSVEPTSGKVGATATATGENLNRPTVAAVFLSDANTDYKVSVVEQTAEKIVFRVPTIKPAIYNISLQVKNDIFIQPVRFTVE